MAERLTVGSPSPVLVTFNGHRFDLPLLMRRARYLGVDFPQINIDRFKSPHIDLFGRMTLNGTLKGHSLGFYVRRLGWKDLVKPLSGREESQVPVTGQWDALADSLRHDVLAVKRMAQWLDVIGADTRSGDGPLF
jgi:DNA polymerase elongation subunit (family B)